MYNGDGIEWDQAYGKFAPWELFGGVTEFCEDAI
jgi:hypothetical protein